MKKLVISLCILISFATMPMAAQTMVYDLAPKKMNCLQQWEYALSPEGILNSAERLFASYGLQRIFWGCMVINRIVHICRL